MIDVRRTGIPSKTLGPEIDRRTQPETLDPSHSPLSRQGIWTALPRRMLGCIENGVKTGVVTSDELERVVQPFGRNPSRYDAMHSDTVQNRQKIGFLGIDNAETIVHLHDNARQYNPRFSDGSQTDS